MGGALHHYFAEGNMNMIKEQQQQDRMTKDTENPAASNALLVERCEGFVQKLFPLELNHIAEIVAKSEMLEVTMTSDAPPLAGEMIAGKIIVIKRPVGTLASIRDANPNIIKTRGRGNHYFDVRHVNINTVNQGVLKRGLHFLRQKIIPAFRKG